MGELLAITALLMFSANIIVTNIAAKQLSIKAGYLISVLSNIAFAAVLFCGRLLFSPAELKWHAAAFFLFLAGGFFATFLGRYWFFMSIPLLGPAKASAFQLCNPLFTFIIAWFFLDEKISGLDLVWMACMLAGLGLASYVPESGRHDAAGQAAGGSLYRGVVVALLGALAYAIGNVFRGSAVDLWNEPILGALIGAAVGAALHLALNREARRLFRSGARIGGKATALYILSGMLTVSAQSCLMASMYFMPVSIANLITLSTPVIVTPVSYFLLKNAEKLSWVSVLGIFMALFGIIMIIL